MAPDDESGWSTSYHVNIQVGLDVPDVEICTVPGRYGMMVHMDWTALMRCGGSVGLTSDGYAALSLVGVVCLSAQWITMGLKYRGYTYCLKYNEK